MDSNSQKPQAPSSQNNSDLYNSQEETSAPSPKPNIGLTSEEAKILLEKHGKNLVFERSRWQEILEYLRFLADPMGLMMLGLATLYFMTGHQSDAVIILVAYIPIMAVDVFLERRSDKALRELRETLQLTAKVYRDGRIQEIAIEVLVPGDVVIFEEGQKLPADGKILECQNFAVNEAALTGESLPVEKLPQMNFFAGTTVLSGRGLGLIEKTGLKTNLGKISHLLGETKQENTPLQKKVQGLVKKVLVIAAVLVVVLFVLEWMRGESFIKSLITALTFGMAAVPEEFPLVFTLYLSLGAWRLSKHGVLVKTLPSVESLGNVDVICTDKTGTLTEGKFSLVEIVQFGTRSPEEVSRAALLACEPTPVDSMEAAICEKIPGFTELQNQWNLIFDYPFEPRGKHMTHVWKNAQGAYFLAMKGAAEGVLEHAKVSPEEKQEILDKVTHFASQGKRILGLALKEGELSGDRAVDEKDVEFCALLIFSDPIRPSAKKAIAECQKSGIAVKMLTGDHKLTAHAIADELEIAHTEESIFGGAELQEMTPLELEQAFLQGSIFARVSPEQKFAMIKTLKEKGKVVAMTGDGVNDSPALKLADIGVSMGENATDVARSTAKMILLKNNFQGIVEAILEGRRIFGNLRKSFSYLIAFHIPVVLLALLPPVFGWEQILMPVHIILLELIVHPISAFAFENLKSQELKSTKSILPAPLVMSATVSGLLITLLGLGPYLIWMEQESFNAIRSWTLAIVIYGNIGFMLLETWPEYKTRRILLISGVLLALPVLFSNTDSLSKYFHLEPMGIVNLGICLAVGLAASIPAILYRRKFMK